MRLSPFALLFAFPLFFCTCDSAQSGNSSTDTEMAEQPGAFDEIEAAMESGAGLAEVRDRLLRDYAKVADAQTGRIDPRASQQYIELANRLAGKAQGDTLAALPLYKAAEVHQALNDFKGAADVFSRIHREYPEFSKSGEALFMLAFTYDENLKDFDRAKATYEQFIRDYPENTFADDAEMLINNLGKTDEEILQSLERQQQ